MEEKLLRFARTFCILLTVVISVVALSRTASIAGTTEGADWLYTQVQPDGSFALTDDISTAYQSTAEALRVFHTLGITSPADASAKQFLANEPFQNTEYLARRLIAESDAGSTVSLTLNELLARQNIDGGWGDLAGYDSTVLDTAFALEALGHVGFLGNEVGSALYYLSSTQQADGGWSDGVNASSVYTTAQILAAMGNYQGFYVLNAEIAAAQNYVSSQQVAGNLWNETFQSALALIGLISTTDDLTGLSAQVSALRAAQLADGSWEGKVYATALAVRALKLSEASPMNPGLASITGILVDGQTGLPLASVTVDVTGPDNRQVVSGSNGVFAIHDLIGGSYTLVFSLANYNSVTATTTVGAQQNVNFGTIQLLQGANATTGTIRGTVTDSANGQGLSGVTLTVSTVPAPVQTDANGNFQISNVPTGALTIVADKSGYSSATGSANMTAGGLLVFSPRLTSVTAPTTAIQGTVTDGNTGQPLSEVAISVTGSSTASAVTDAQGAYRIDNLVPGIITVEASLAGYDSATAITSIALNTLVNFSPALYPTNTTPPGSNTAGVRGVVLDSTTNQPLAGVSVVATFGTVTQSQTTGADGIFELAGFTETVGIAQFSLAGFTDVTIALNLTLLEVLDIGQVRLRPEGVVSLLPDLIVQNIDTLGASNDPDTLAMTGSIDVEVTNQGTSSVPASIALVAFYDANQSGQYEAGIDTLLGERTTTSAIDVGGSENVTINVEGTLLYRDAPIRVFVDSAQTIIESNEANNVATSASACEVQPDIGTFEPVLKWEWSGSSVLPTFDQVLTTPLVIQASDDNADGNINTDDMPDIAFISYPNTNTNGIRVNGVLTIVSGDDGSELVTVTNLQYSLNGYGNLAAADIDNDGIVEIIGPRSTIAGGGVIVFDHNGDVKWVNTQTGVLGVGGASVADLDADGSPEIIAGNSVLNSDGTIKWQWTGYVGGIDSVLRGGIPLAADINLDGEQEVVVGASAYSSTGQLLWVNETVGDGFGGLGNFDEDEFPEIVIVSAGRVFLLEHTGEVKWGPVSIPGGGRGGSPTVADVDGDGEPEIGVAGSSRYAVFKSDGSLLWSTNIQDMSSHITGSSVFDFDGDGQSEVVYADEIHMWVFRGSDGSVLFQRPNSSGTAIEYPVIADVDNDNHADIVISANQLLQIANGVPGPANTGLLVFQDVNNSWVNTRKIWNQHAYHITNINDDGTVPAIERNSWETHNTYRLNAIIGQSSTAVPDLTASQLVVIPQAGGGVTLALRIGNAGPLATPNGVVVAFYEGDPNTGGILIGSINVDSLAPDSFRNAQLIDVTALSGLIDLFAVVDADDQISECNESNNTVQIPAPDLLPDLIIASVDASTASANLTTLGLSGSIDAVITNQGVAGAGSGYGLSAFYDVNNDGDYDQGDDLLLGSATNTIELAIGESANVAIPVMGTLPFRDAPVSVWVDSGLSIEESIESNNVGRTSNACVVEPSQGNLITDPFDPRTWLGASVGTFATLYYGADTAENRIQVVNDELLVDGIFDPTGAIPATLISAGGSGGCLGASSGGGGLAYSCSYGSDVSIYANQIDNLWFQTSGVIGNTVFDLGFQAEKVAVFNSIDHGPLPGEAIESTIYLSNDRINWTQAVTERVWLEGYLTSEVYDGFVYTVGTGTGESFRYVSVINGGPDALVRDGDNEINGLLGLQSDLTQGQPDLTAAVLEIIDNGTAQPYSLSVRVGNAGTASSPLGITVSFYEGDPAAGGIQLGSTTIDPVAPNTYLDIQIDGVTGITGNADIFAVVDADDTVLECDETNNVVLAPVPDSMLGQISVSTDASVYAPSTDVLLQADAANTGALSGIFSATLQVEDAAGVIVASFAGHNLGELAGGASVAFTDGWNTASYLAGPYVLRGKLYGADGAILGESVAFFSIEHPQAAGVAVSLRTTTDKPVYHDTATVQIQDVIQNLTQSTLIDDALLRLTVMDLSGTTIHTQDIPLGQLLPGTVRDLVSPLILQAAPTGTYTVLAAVIDNADASLLSSDQATFLVQPDLGLVISGTVVATYPTREAGEPQTCIDNVTNSGSVTLSDLPLRQVFARMDDAVEVSTTESSLSLTAGETGLLERTAATTGLSAGDYACILQASIDGVWTTLDAAIFTVTVPPINIEAALATGDRGRVLVLVDTATNGGGADSCTGIASLDLGLSFNPAIAGDATATVQVFNASGTLIDSEAIDLATLNGPANANPGIGGVDLRVSAFTTDSALLSLDGTAATGGVLGTGYQVVTTLTEGTAVRTLDSTLIPTSCQEPVFISDIYGGYQIRDLSLVDAANDPHGNADIPAPSYQLAFLEQLLTNAGWTYTIVTDGDAFATEMRTGGYTTYLLLSEQVQLAVQVEEELREAVFRGEGLVVAGGHDERNGKLEDALGVKVIGKHSNATGVNLAASGLHVGFNTGFIFGEHTLRLGLAGATSVGDFNFATGSNVPADTSAVLTQAYGSGKSVMAGFDLLAEATGAGTTSPYAELLLNALAYVHPSSVTPVPGAVLPLQLMLTNLGIATPGEVALTLPAGVSVVDAGPATVQPDGTLRWVFSLTETEVSTLTVWVKLPDTTSTLTVTAAVSTGVAPNLLAHTTASLDVVMQPAATLAATLSQLAPIAADNSRANGYRKAETSLGRAQTWLNASNYTKALQELLKAANDLMGIHEPDADTIRLQVDQVIRAVERLL